MKLITTFFKHWNPSLSFAIHLFENNKRLIMLYDNTLVIYVERIKNEIWFQSIQLNDAIYNETANKIIYLLQCNFNLWSIFVVFRPWPKILIHNKIEKQVSVCQINH